MIKKHEAMQILRHSDQSLKLTLFKKDELEVKTQVETADLSLETSTMQDTVDESPRLESTPQL